jgi:hypothetical protein
MTASPNFAIGKATDPLVHPLFEMSGHFSVDDPGSYFHSLICLDLHYGTCTLVRRTISVPCVYGISSDTFVLLTFATYSNETICLTEIPTSGFFLQSVLMNEFGRFRLFHGHPVFQLKLSSIFSVFGRSNDISIHSYQFGSCVLSFDSEVPSQFEQTNPIELKGQIMQSWLANRCSTSEMLIIINHLAGRTFDDLSAYPVFPRVLRAFSSDSFIDELSQVRDLSLPLAVLADRDPEHQVLHQRMEMQSYHHCENVSTAASVSSLLVRVIPFLNFQMSFHEGFDVIDRIFRSIRIQFSINHITNSEFSPEVFLMPEMFLNLNKISVDNIPLEMELPPWATNAFSFTELHRYALESPSVRLRLNRWIDLIFGFKQSGPEAIEALNLYHPLSYTDSPISAEQKSIRRTWTKSCGQIPVRIFDSPAPQFQARRLSDDLKFCLNPSGVSEPIVLDCLSASISGMVQYCHEDLLVAIDCQISTRGGFVAVTFATSKVIIFRINTTAALEKQAVLLRESALFSVVNDRQLICATVCPNEIILWSIVNGSLINIIDCSGVNALVFDDDLDAIFFVSEECLFQASLNGQLLRRLNLPGKEPTALALVVRGYTFDHRFVLVGTKDGVVLEISTDFQTLELVVILELQVSQFPIAKFIGNRWSCVVDVLDTVGAQSVCI